MKKETKLVSALTMIPILLYLKFIYECPLILFFGVACPGCGMTRAFFSLMKLDYEKAFKYHPLFPLVIVIVMVGFFVYIGKIKMNRKTRERLLFAISAVFIIVYLYRFINGSDIVKFYPNDTIWYRLYELIKK